MRTPQNELERQVEAAFTYRGDVTVELADGSSVEGYLYNRDFAPHPSLKTEPFLELSLPDAREQRYPLAEVRAVRLTGRDHAAV